MKIYIYIITIVLTSLASAQEIDVSLDDVAQKVRESNFTVLENAQRVYQAKETINFSKRNLLPRLNFWNVLKLPFDWLSSVDIVQDIAPFLVPNNWFRLSQNKLFYLAQKEQYRALWANEVMTAKLLYLNALRDRDFLRILKVQESQVDELLSIVKSRVILGGERAQILKFFEIRKLEIQDDIRSLSTIFFDEKKALSFLMGVPSEKELKLVDIELPSLEDLSEISFDTFVFRALDNAPEINQYKYIKDSLRFVRREAYFSFLGASSTSRSSSVFNNIPVQDGLGFGMGSSLRIAGSESKILEINMNATKEVIKKNLYNLVNNYNSYLKNIEGQKNRNKYSQENFKLIKGQLVLGGSIDPLEVLTSIESVFDSSISLTNYEYEAVTTMEKIKRSIFNDDYSKKESKLHLVIKGRN